MPTIFIALQCFQCSTMQVKQQKKSSNKWVCVVCNHKQSVRKVYAQGFMARDVRKFVQSFNMSRQFAEQQGTEQTLDPPVVPMNNQFDSSSKDKKRTDWSEYIDPEDDYTYKIEEKQGDKFEPKVVTELPKALFKKPKLNNYSSDSKQLLEPVFLKRGSNKHISSQEEPRNCQTNPIKGASKWRDYKMPDEEPRRCQPTMTKGVSKWSAYATQDGRDECAENEPRTCQPATAKGASKWRDRMTKDDDNELEGKVPWTCQPTVVQGPSKWNDYIADDDDDDDDDDLQFRSKRDFAGDVRECDHGVLETVLNDHRVEEDIHPDFR